MIGLKRILVPTDFTESSEAALKYGLALAGTFGATVHVLHVSNEPLHESWIGYAPGTSFVTLMEQLKSNARTRIESLVPKEHIAVGRIVPAAIWGDPSEEILAYALAHNIDLIVCGTHGRRGWDHFVMGSVAEKVVRRAPCPVLTIHHPEHEFVLPDGMAESARPTA
jgi:nucleotide-binding universal stress UspA family protein